MSENSGSSAPTAAPAATPAAAQPATPAPASPTNLVNAPPPASQEAISLSDAGRLLARRRQEAAREAQGHPTGHPTGQPAPTRAAPQTAPAAPTAAPAESKPAEQPSDSYDTIAKALGLPEGGTPQAAPDGTQPAAPIGGAYEIDGQNYSAEQLRAALLAHRDYTKKTQELGAQRQQLQQQAEALATVLPHIQPELAKLGQQLQGAQPPDHSLIESNPQEYLRQFHAYQQAAAEQQRLGTLTQLQQQAYQRAMEQQVEAGNKVLAEKYDFWRDDAMRGLVQRDIAKWAQTKGGFTHQELQGLSDPRHVDAMLKAMMYDHMVDGTKTSAPQRPQTARVRGSPPPPAPAAAVHAAEQAFEAQPNTRNAAALLSARRASANGSSRY